MIRSISDPDSHRWEVINMETGNPIRNVQWADDDTGEYEVLVLNEAGNVHSVRCKHCGNFTIVTKAMYGIIKFEPRELNEQST